MVTNEGENPVDGDIASKLNRLDIISLKDGLTGLWNKKYLWRKKFRCVIYH